MKRYVLGGLLAAIAMFVWGAVFWMSPVPTSVMQTATDDVALGQALKAQMSEVQESGAVSTNGTES